MDEHDQALPFWVARGVRDATLVHIDAHDDFRAIDARRMEPLLEAIRSGDATAVAELADNEGTGGSYNLGDFVYAAVRSGIVKRAIWVVPAHKGTEPLTGWREWMEQQGFAASEIKSLSSGPGGVTGTINGAPLTICTPDEFVAPAEDVLLDIDADFFPVYSATLSQSNPLGPTHDVMSKILGGGTRVSFATVASSVSGDYLQLEYEWLADVAAVALVQPDLLLSAGPPPAWGAMGEAAALEGVDDAEAANRWRAALAAAPESASPWYGLGRSLLALGEEEDAIDAMTRAAELDPVYAYGWVQTAAELSRAGDSRAIDFIERAKGDVSPFLYGVRRADILYNLERFEDAASAYEKLSVKYDHPDVWMYLGDSYMELGKTAEAEKAYLSGMDALEAVTFRSPEDYLDSLPTLGRIAEQTGRTKLARDYYETYLTESPDGAEAAEIGRRLAHLGE